MKVKPPGVSWVAAVSGPQRSSGAGAGGTRSSDRVQLGRFESMVRRIVAEQDVSEEVDPSRLQAARQFIESGGIDGQVDGLVDAILEESEWLAELVD